eukprot:176028_1
MTTADRGKGKNLNKFSHIFKKNGIIANYETHGNGYSQNNEIRHSRSVSVPRHKFNDIHIPIMQPSSPQRPQKIPQRHITHASSMVMKKSVFNDEDCTPVFNAEDITDDLPDFSPPLSAQHRSSLTLEQNPLATTPMDASPNPLTATTQAMSLDDLSNIMQQTIDDETGQKVNINITDSEEDEDELSQSYSYSYDALQNDNAMEEYPPGYTIGLSNKRKKGSCIDNDDAYKRRKSNRKDVWRRMMLSIMDGVGTFGANALQKLSEYEMDEEDMVDGEEYKYETTNGINPRKYISVTRNCRLFRHNGYTVKRRLSSHECLSSRYTAKCYRRKHRPRSKSDPTLLPFTTRFNRKLEVEYRPGTMNIFQMNTNKKRKSTCQYPTRAHQDSIYFRYVFDDSDFEDDSLEDWSDDELGFTVATPLYNVEIPQAATDTKPNHTSVPFPSFNSSLSAPHSRNPNKLSTRLSFGSMKSLSVKQNIGKRMKLIKSTKSAPLTKQRTIPYGGHVEASESMIENEFGSDMNHINVYSVKKRNKVGRDIDRIAVLDIPLQVLRIKDKKNKTHKEHIVWSASNEENADRDDDEVSMSRSYSHVIQLNGHNHQRLAHQKHERNRDRFDTEMFDNLADDGNVYTGAQTANVVYRIVKINKWGTKKERTMIVHKSDRTVRLFDDKRRCHSEYPMKIMATLDIIDSLNVEVVFTIDQKPTRFVFRSHVDLWDFVEQIRTVAPNEIMVNDRRQGGRNKKKATILPPVRTRGASAAAAPIIDEFDDDDDDFDINPLVLRYSVLRLIKSQGARGGGGRNQEVTWRQHRRCIYLDLEKRVVRMLTLGMHIKD